MWARTFERSAHEQSKKLGPIYGMLILREPARTAMLIWRAPFAKIRSKFVKNVSFRTREGTKQRIPRTRDEKKKK